MLSGCITFDERGRYRRSPIVMTMELRRLATFVAVAETGGFSRAAARLGVVQSAVSAGIRRLEDELETTLLDRTTHRVELTDAGRALLPEARATLAAARSAREAVDAVRGGLRGTVALGMMQTGAVRSVNVAELMAAFRAEHPEVELRALQGNSAEMADAVRDGRLDFAILSLPYRRVTGVTLTTIDTEPMLLAVAAGHRLAGRADVELSAIADEDFADGPPPWGTRIAVDRAFAAAGVERRVTLEVNSVDTLAEFVRHGLAVAILPESFARTREGLAFIPIRHHAPVFVSSLAEPANRRPTAAAAALAQLAREHAAR
jgi:DNA-binding transcriptional LysR family regulator